MKDWSGSTGTPHSCGDAPLPGTHSADFFLRSITVSMFILALIFLGRASEASRSYTIMSPSFPPFTAKNLIAFSPWFRVIHDLCYVLIFYAFPYFHRIFMCVSVGKSKFVFALRESQCGMLQRGRVNAALGVSLAVGLVWSVGSDLQIYRASPAHYSLIKGKVIMMLFI